jgi:hypothetical protein
MAYTPGTGFLFSATPYTPGATFVLGDGSAPETLTGALLATLEGVSGQFGGHQYQNAGVFSAPLAGVSGDFSGANVLLGQIDATLSGVSGQFIGLSYQNRGAWAAALSGVSGGFAAVNAPQGLIATTLAGVSGSFAAVNAPQGIVSTTLAGVSGQFSGRNVANAGSFSAALVGVSGDLSGFYNPNVHRYAVAALCSHQGSAALLSADKPIARAQAAYAAMTAHASQQDGTPRNTALLARFDATAPLRIEACASTTDGVRSDTQAVADVQQLVPVDISAHAPIQQATRSQCALFSALYQLELIFTESRPPIDDSNMAVHTFLRRVYGEPPEAFRYTPGAAFVFTVNADYNPADPFVWPYTVPPIDRVENSQRSGIRRETYSHWQRATRHRLHQCSTVQGARRPPPGTSIWIDPPRPPPVTPPGHTTFNIPDQTSYIMQHSLSVTLLDLTPIPMASVRLSYDADSFAWQFSGQLADKAALPMVKQSAGQPPVQLIVTINGYSWKVLVERIGRGHEFAKNHITLTGRGLTALLGQPYEQPASATQGSALTVQQLAELLLPPGWTINWTAPTWLVPAGAYSYSNQTPIQALAAIAKDIGAMLVPSIDSQTINIMPRYPVMPWDFALASPDVTVPEAAIVGATETTVAPSQANAVYVHGAEIGGVLAWCRLTGTAGDRLAPSVSNALMTDVVGCRALGERILAGQYEQPGIQSITLPMDGATIPLVSVGQLAQITVDSVPVRGIVNGVSIDATLASVRQTIQIGEETPNQWTLFKDLLPRDPLLFATLFETDGTTSLMTLLDGGVVRVRGTGTVGGKYYIRAGKIDGEAPNMVQSEVVI